MEYFNILMKDEMPQDGDKTLAVIEFSRDERYAEDYLDITIVLNKDWFHLDDEEIKNKLRHELLHDELGKGDYDIEFIEEALRRNIPVNESSGKVLYAHRINQNMKAQFDEELFEFCFPEGIAYWGKFLPKNTMKNKEAYRCFV